MRRRHSNHPTTRRAPAALAVSLLAAALLVACGGSDSSSSVAQTSGPVSTATTVLDLQSAPPDDVASAVATPTLHLAPVLLDEPSDVDATSATASVFQAPRMTAVPGTAAAAGAGRTTARAMSGLQRGTTLSADAGASPDVTPNTVVTYTPAQIRAAYSLPAMPLSFTSLTAAQAAQMGAGQTIYIVDAYHDPNAAAELAAFNAKFGLPTCTTTAIAATTKLPLAAASASACQFSVVYATAAGAMSATAPAANSGWAEEIALDIEWAHATAPLARIVLLEAPDASLNSLLGAVNLANAMGPGVVSMSFGASEGSWTSSVESSFTAANMTYVASTGDSGAGVSWPAVSPHVLAVGGTSLTSAGNGTRSETTWSGSGGGYSSYTARPSYQAANVPGIGSSTFRGVADVSFNADPYTGEYLAVMSGGSISWLSGGGTSLSAPQWAGLMAVANAMRAQSGKAPLGAPHALLYGSVAPIPGTYAADMNDITTGNDGSCATCSAKTGYDTPTGLGTPTAAALLATLGAPSAPTPPVVTSATINGTAATPLSFTANVSAPDPVTLGLTNAPSGMTIAANGVVSWPAPVAGTYGVTVTATDTKTLLKGTGLYTVVVTAPPPPVVSSATVAGQVGSAFSLAVSVTAPNPVTLTMAGAPTGMAMSASGLISWTSPVAGSYHVTVNAKDTKTGLVGSGVETITIAQQVPPTVTPKTVSGLAGSPLSFAVTVSAQNAVSYTLSGAPSGMTISAAGLVSWPIPVAGNYSVVVAAKDSKSGLSGSATMSVQITPSGLSIQAPAMSGVAGKALTGTIAITDPGVASISVSISNVPLGVTFSASGLTITWKWASPVTGSYAMKVVAYDSAGRSSTATVPITITAK